METKICTKCGVEYPATTEFFYRDKYKKSGLIGQCKKCKSEYEKEYNKKNKEKRNKSSKNWRENNKEKKKEIDRKYYENNKEKIKKYQKEYREKNIDKIRKQDKIYRENNKEKIREYREKNKEKIQKWREENKEKIRENQRKYYKNDKKKYREKRLKYLFGITLKEYDKMLKEQNSRCVICGTKKVGRNQYNNRSLGVDHDHKTGKIRGLLCNNCNTTLGFLKDNPLILIKAVKYLQKYS